MSLFNRIFKRFSKAAVIKRLMINSGFNNLSNTEEDVHKLIYRCEDASLPPEFHRNYTIKVLPEKIHILTESYGKVLLNKSFTITKNTYASFVRALLELNIKAREEVKSNGCTGGALDKLDIHIGRDYVVNGYTYYCGSEKFGNLEGNVLKAAELFKTLIPNLKVDKRI